MKTTIVILAVALLSGCYKTEYGPLESEPGLVRDLVFVPSGHGTGVGVGMSSGGSGVVTSTSVDIPARYGIVFECEHGSFALDGSKYKELWSRLKVGQPVTINYRIEYRVVDGARVPHDLDFITAEPRP